MSIVEETRKALLQLFPEQAAAEAEAEAAAEAGAAAGAEADTDATAEDTASTEEAGEAAGGEETAAEPAAPAKEEGPAEEGPRENGVLVTDHAARGTHLDVLCDPDQVVEAAGIMDEAGFFLEAITGVDWIKEDRMEVIYDYNQMGPDPCRVVVRTFIPRANPEIPTISEIHPGANWHERETHDFFGIKFQGHPYLEPLLLPEDADFHPLLKDFTP